MSSSNLVRLAVIPETVYGETPVTGNFKTARFISEGLSGTPETVESQQIRNDRMSSGQIVTGLTVGGDVGFELAKEPVIDLFLSSAMLSDWETFSLITASITIDAADKTATRASGSWIADGLKPGQFATLAGFDDDENNTQVMVSEVVSATVLKFVGPEDMVDGSGSATTFKRADQLKIGTTKKSFSMEKKFLDLLTRGSFIAGCWLRRWNSTSHSANLSADLSASRVTIIKPSIKRPI